MIPRQKHPIQIPKPPRASSLVLDPPVQDPSIPGAAPPAPNNYADNAPPTAAPVQSVQPSTNPAYQRVIDRNLPSVLPSPRQADTSFLGRMKTAALAGLTGLVQHYAQMPEYSSSPQGDWSDLLSGVAPAAIGAISPQTIENQRYYTRDLPMFMEQEKLKASNREAAYKGQKAELDQQKVAADIQHTGAQTKNTTAQAAGREAELPYASRKASAGADKAETDSENARKTGINLGLTGENLKARTEGQGIMNETNRRLMPTKVESAEVTVTGKKLDNTAKEFKNQNAPEDRRIRNEQIQSTTYRNYNSPGRTGQSKVNVGAAKDKALTEWSGGGEAAAKQKFVKEQIARWADLEGTPEEKAAMASRKWEKEKEKHKKAFVEARSLEDRNAQRGTSSTGSTRDGKSLNDILNGR